MKFFLDTANLDELKKAPPGALSTVSPPTLLSSPRKACRSKSRSAAFATSWMAISARKWSRRKPAQMIREGRELAKIHKNVVIKVPLTRDGIKACSALSKDGYKVNVTLCFSAGQALLAAKAGAYFVSPFVGRLDDIGADGMELIRQIVTIYRTIVSRHRCWRRRCARPIT